MKKSLLFAVVVLLPAFTIIANRRVNACEVCTTIYALDSCYGGVFVTQDDFVHNRLSYRVNTAVKGYKLNFSFPADLTYKLEIVTPDTTYKFIPGSIYGYSDCGKVYHEMITDLLL